MWLVSLFLKKRKSKQLFIYFKQTNCASSYQHHLFVPVYLMLNMWWRIRETGTWADKGWHRIETGLKLFMVYYPQCSWMQNYFIWLQFRGQEFQLPLCKMLRLGFKMKQNNDDVKILLDYQIVLFSCKKKNLVHLDSDLGSVIFPHQFDRPCLSCVFVYFCVIACSSLLTFSSNSLFFSIQACLSSATQTLVMFPSWFSKLD